MTILLTALLAAILVIVLEVAAVLVFLWLVGRWAGKRARHRDRSAAIPKLEGPDVPDVIGAAFRRIAEDARAEREKADRAAVDKLLESLNRRDT